MYVAKVVLIQPEKPVYSSCLNYYSLFDANVLKIIRSTGLYYRMELYLKICIEDIIELLNTFW